MNRYEILIGIVLWTIVILLLTIRGHSSYSLDYCAYLVSKTEWSTVSYKTQDFLQHCNEEHTLFYMNTIDYWMGKE